MTPLDKAREKRELELEMVVVDAFEEYDRDDILKCHIAFEDWMESKVPQLRGLTKGHLLQRIANAREFVRKHAKD